MGPPLDSVDCSHNCAVATEQLVQNAWYDVTPYVQRTVLCKATDLEDIQNFCGRAGAKLTQHDAVVGGTLHRQRTERYTIVWSLK
jgi:hypothetical protein